MALVIYLNSTERTGSSTQFKKKCIIFGNENENFYAARKEVPIPGGISYFFSLSKTFIC